MNSKILKLAAIPGAVVVASAAGALVLHFINSDWAAGAVSGAIGGGVGALVTVYLSGKKKPEN